MADFSPLEKLDGRSLCPDCKHHRKYYCYDCMKPLAEAPSMKLPVNVTVIRHPKEKRSKSSVIPTKVLAPDEVDIVHTIEVPEDLIDKEDRDATVLMFPSEGA